jgi:uncharacterized protein
MELNIPLILHAVLEDYALPWGGYHGVVHRARVLENGLRLAEEAGANVEVVSLFAVLHDSKRLNEGFEPDHGPRAAVFALSILGRLFDLPDHEFGLLHRACAGHTHERTHPDVTVQTCWDAGRLELGRVGVTTHPGYLCTEVARRPDVLAWADRRATSLSAPGFIWRGVGHRPGGTLRPFPCRTRCHQGRRAQTRDG